MFFRPIHPLSKAEKISLFLQLDKKDFILNNKKPHIESIPMIEKEARDCMKNFNALLNQLDPRNSESVFLRIQPIQSESVQYDEKLLKYCYELREDLADKMALEAANHLIKRTKERLFQSRKTQLIINVTGIKNTENLVVYSPLEKNTLSL